MGGGVLELLAHVEGLNRAEALEWLRRRGLLDGPAPVDRPRPDRTRPLGIRHRPAPAPSTRRADRVKQAARPWPRSLEQTCVWGMCVGGITRETYNMRGFRIRTCSQGGLAPWPSPWAAPPSMPVENPAAVNSSVRPRSRKRAWYGLSRLRTGEAAEAPHRSVRVVTIVGCGRRP